MKGAKEYANLFKTGQYGKLFIASGFHARGKTFRIYVLPNGIKEDSGRCLPLCADAIEVYGVIGGNPGWTEEYGWLHKGQWCEDFKKLVGEAKQKVTAEAAKVKQQREEETVNETNRMQHLLSQY